MIERQSGREQPHSKTLSRQIARCSFREVLECGCPLPLLLSASTGTVSFVGLMPVRFGIAGLLTSAGAA
jgi:hypothetical protein